MNYRATLRRRSATIALTVLAASLAIAPAGARAAGGFGPLSGPGGCLVAPGQSNKLLGTDGCGEGKALVGADAVAVSPDGANVYVTAGVEGTNVATSFGGVAILKRDGATGAVSEVSCLSSDGTDGRDGASGACSPTPSLLGADGVAVSPDGLSVFVSSSSSASVVAFSRDPATGLLTRVGCLQSTPRLDSPCAGANLFSGSSSPVVNASGNAVYVAASLEGALTALTTSSRTTAAAGVGSPASPPIAATGAGLAPAASLTPAASTTPAAASTPGAAATTPAPGAATSVPGASAATPESTLASTFTLAPGNSYANPCIAVNGLDGPCGVGTAMNGIDSLALSPDGKQLYGTATGSGAVDVFTPDSTGAPRETSCLKLEAPPGLCRSSKNLEKPATLSISPDGKNVYVGDSAGVVGKIDVLTRDPATGTLADSSCVEFEAEPPKPEPEEDEEAEAESSSADGNCAGAPGLDSPEVVAVSGDGSSVYAIGSGSAAIFSRDPASGKLTETSCASTSDSRCTALPALSGVQAAAVSPDGREVYVAAAKSDAVMVFGLGAAVTTASAPASRAGSTRMSVLCPAGLRRRCTGRVRLTRAYTAASRSGHAKAARRVPVGQSSVFSIAPGRHATIHLQVSRAALSLLQSHGSVRLMASVRVSPSAGGSGYGRHVVLRLTAH